MFDEMRVHSQVKRALGDSFIKRLYFLMDKEVLTAAEKNELDNKQHEYNQTYRQVF